MINTLLDNLERNTLNDAGNNFATVVVTSGNNVALRDAGALVLGASTIGGTFDVTVGGALTQSGAVTAGLTTLVAGGFDITLDDMGNNFTTVAVTSVTSTSTRSR